MRGTGRNGGSHRWACPEAASLTVPKTPGPWLIAPSPRAHPGLGRGRPRAASGQRSCRRTDVPPGARSALLAGASYIPRRDEEAEPTSPVGPEASERAASAPQTPRGSRGSRGAQRPGTRRQTRNVSSPSGWGERLSCRRPAWRSGADAPGGLSEQSLS